MILTVLINNSPNNSCIFFYGSMSHLNIQQMSIFITRYALKKRILTSKKQLLTKPILDQSNQLLFALVGRLDILDQLLELDVAVGRK